jgi:isocitrate dehydrogenase
MCQTKDIAIKDWVKLAVSRARATGRDRLLCMDLYICMYILIYMYTYIYIYIYICIYTYTGVPTVFWLDEGRAHDRNLISKIKTYLKDHDTQDLNIQIMTPEHAMRYSCERARYIYI